MKFNTRKTNKPGQKGVAERFCMQRLDQSLLPACVITHLGVTLEGGDFNALPARHPDAKQMSDDAGPKMLYGNMGDELRRRTASYPYPVPYHD